MGHRSRVGPGGRSFVLLLVPRRSSRLSRHTSCIYLCGSRGALYCRLVLSGFETVALRGTLFLPCVDALPIRPNMLQAQAKTPQADGPRFRRVAQPYHTTRTNAVRFSGGAPFVFEGRGFRSGVAQASRSNAYLNSRSGANSPGALTPGARNYPRPSLRRMLSLPSGASAFH